MGDAAQITCPNTHCQAPNPESHKFCQKCRTPIPKRYLWAVGSGIEAYKPGKLLAERYVLKRDRILLDTKPGLVPLFPQDITDAIAPYLYLFPYRLHVPQVYGLLPPLKKSRKEVIWLLEEAPICTDAKSLKPNLMTELATAWENAPAIRQLNWLWQIAQLWQPFSIAGVTASLLKPKLLRVEGPIVRLLELRQDREEPNLSELGQLWLQWAGKAQPEIADFLVQLCQSTIKGQLFPEDLLAQLDGALYTVGQSQERIYQIASYTDTGPTRLRNEDACYPDSGNFYQVPAGSQALTVVCDGIGGHEGGNVASSLAIETVVAEASRWQNHQLADDAVDDRVGSLGSLKILPSNDLVDLSSELERAICNANDLISQRNDSEGRYDRQRMGTTLVMALTQAHEMYITHIGDSRVYWITRHSCHQITVDDDVASREVRLGYTLYREALQQIGSGSLVQALGMSSSNNLHPTVQRFVIDEDCIFMLCSDGLSDSDRVEQYWDTEIVPVLEGKINLATAAARLIEIGNTQNGHDNVTVGLVYCQVRDKSAGMAPTLVIPESVAYSASARTQDFGTPSTLKTQLLPTRLAKPSLLPLLGGIALLLGLGTALVYFTVGKWGDLPVSNPDSIGQTKPHSSSQESPVSSRSPLSLSPGLSIAVSIANNSQSPRSPLLLYEGPQKQNAIGVIPEGTILEIKSKAVRDGDSWLKLKVCKIPATLNSQKLPATYNLVIPAQEGWIRQVELESNISQNSIQKAAGLGKCTGSGASASPGANR
ncbi:protein phosphatase 2C domain-containing protein [Planktothrix sp. FACHB-1355]|uniref:Protein phosphatase 2C domain-containing protein n=2 Tax=Cyanophyceae TaxID=3028117 RepID=A0A926ZGH2_9CYAN|nr:protein phosphatase 2C domain-containing protein [Aerosakkonema funiforme FACHB-1375]MBD3557893.1 protein phosphatase 2C domain-containing protein [Planktothrix sp. FACHB-1355]